VKIQFKCKEFYTTTVLEKMNQKEILWLASWYPNEINPVAGDFIQRHALAVSAFRKLTVIYMDQSGWGKNSCPDKTTTEKKGNLTEIRSYFSYTKTNIPFADKLLYNLKYTRRYKKLLRTYFSEKGYPDLIHVHVPMKAGKLALWAKRKWGIPFLISEQASTYLPSAPDHFNKRSFYYRHTAIKIFREAAAATNVSATIGRLLEKITGKKNIRVIHNTVDETLFYYKPGGDRKFRFIHVSAMNDQKNISGILQAFGDLSAIRSDWELRLVGPVSSNLQTTLDDLPWSDKISCSGEVPYAAVAFEMQQASAFVLFSNHENFPCVIVEALACGLPVITSAAGGSGEAIQKKNGIVVPVGDAEKLVGCLIRLLDNGDNYDRETIALEAIKAYSYQCIGQKFSDLYAEILPGEIKP
jgi:glycosyltransferase involved in cell wall biosynthesis